MFSCFSQKLFNTNYFQNPQTDVMATNINDLRKEKKHDKIFAKKKLIQLLRSIHTKYDNCNNSCKVFIFELCENRKVHHSYNETEEQYRWNHFFFS